jgi:hypothetical protein
MKWFRTIISFGRFGLCWICLGLCGALALLLRDLSPFEHRHMRQADRASARWVAGRVSPLSERRQFAATCVSWGYPSWSIGDVAQPT